MEVGGRMRRVSFTTCVQQRIILKDINGVIVGTGYVRWDGVSVEMQDIVDLEGEPLLPASYDAQYTDEEAQLIVVPRRAQ